MAWEQGLQPIAPHKDTLAEAFAVEGELDDKQARIELGKLLTHNVGSLWELLVNRRLWPCKDMLPFQEIMIRGWMKKDNSLFVAGRGVSKSYSAAMFCLLYCILTPKVKIVLVANNFRRVKDIFLQMETFLKRPEASMLRACFDNSASGGFIRKEPDAYLLKCLNGARVKGLPMSGEKLRGERANVLIVDEGLLISKNIQESILRPFLTAKLDAQEQMAIREQEDELIKMGKLDAKERTIFPPNKMIILSSASFQFEHLYEGIYVPYIKLITEEPKGGRSEGDPTYFVSRMSYEAVPRGTIMEDATLKAALDSGGAGSPVFRREYCAEFVDASGGYFDIVKLQKCTFDIEDDNTTEIVGRDNAKYILALDPAYGAHDFNDYFAMGVYRIIYGEKKIIQVHSYGEAGKDLKDHYKYLAYILKNFNIVFTVIDFSGTEFIQSFNESTVAKEAKVQLGFIQADLNAEDAEYQKAVQQAKTELNATTRNFVFAQLHSNRNNQKMNEYLQAGISAEKVWFAASITTNDTLFDKFKEYPVPDGYNSDAKFNMLDFMADQDDWIHETKKQLALIQIRATSEGNYVYEIPKHMKNSTDKNRPRRDNYTCLLLGYMGSRHYFNIVTAEDAPPMEFFMPYHC